MKNQIKIQQAIEKYDQLQKREINPDGTFDNGGRWYPSENERQDCCDGIRSPSAAYPYSLMVHCRTFQHVCATMKVNFQQAKIVLNEKRKQEKELKLKIKTKVYKIVAMNGKKYVSIYDNSSWKLNVKRNGRKYYVYKTIKAAKERMESNNFPDESKNLDMPKAILECIAYGDIRDAEAGNNKYYCTHVKPIQKIKA